MVLGSFYPSLQLLTIPNQILEENLDDNAQAMSGTRIMICACWNTLKQANEDTLVPSFLNYFQPPKLNNVHQSNKVSLCTYL